MNGIMIPQWGGIRQRSGLIDERVAILPKQQQQQPLQLTKPSVNIIVFASFRLFIEVRSCARFRPTFGHFWRVNVLNKSMAIEHAWDYDESCLWGGAFLSLVPDTASATRISRAKCLNDSLELNRSAVAKRTKKVEKNEWIHTIFFTTIRQQKIFIFHPTSWLSSMRAGCHLTKIDQIESLQLSCTQFYAPS